jgi:hypothetical protein
MSDTAAHLVDRVIPEAPVRQWVLSLPHPVRRLLGYDRKLCGEVLTIFVRTVLAWHRHRAKVVLGLTDAESGAVTVIQRFGYCRSRCDLRTRIPSSRLGGRVRAGSDGVESGLAPLVEVDPPHAAMLAVGFALPRDDAASDPAAHDVDRHAAAVGETSDRVSPVGMAFGEWHWAWCIGCASLDPGTPPGPTHGPRAPAAALSRREALDVELLGDRLVA